MSERYSNLVTLLTRARDKPRFISFFKALRRPKESFSISLNLKKKFGVYPGAIEILNLGSYFEDLNL